MNGYIKTMYIYIATKLEWMKKDAQSNFWGKTMGRKTQGKKENSFRTSHHKRGSWFWTKPSVIPFFEHHTDMQRRNRLSEVKWLNSTTLSTDDWHICLKIVACVNWLDVNIISQDKYTIKYIFTYNNSGHNGPLKAWVCAHVLLCSDWGYSPASMSARRVCWPYRPELSLKTSRHPSSSPTRNLISILSHTNSKRHASIRATTGSRLTFTCNNIKYLKIKKKSNLISNVM